MAGERWIAEAEDLKPAGAAGVMEGGNPRVTLHVTVSKPGTFDAMHGVLTRNRSEPHLLYDPATDRLGQYFPLDTSARALQNDGTRRTNGHGTVNIQIEVCAMPTGFTTGWKPGPNWMAMLRAIRSWGVPDAWPAGRLSATGSDSVDRSWASYSKAGWFGHCNVPGNTHWDPGPINQAAVFGPKEDFLMALDDKAQQRVLDAAERILATVRLRYYVPQADGSIKLTADPKAVGARRAFVLDNVDGYSIRSGQIDASELAQAVTALGVKVDPNELASALAKAITTLATKETPTT